MEMISRTWSSSLLVIGLVIILMTNSCAKEKSITLAELSTAPLTDITSTSITSGGDVSSDGGAVVSARGVCWSENPNPTVSDYISEDGAGAGTFISSIKGLSGGTNYYVRAYATNSTGTAYGNEIIFITPVNDIDGNSYRTVIIGTQVWMRENLKTSRYNDGTLIRLVADNATWSSLSEPGYCWYNNDRDFNRLNYGALYNWFTVNTGKLCPVGWHVPGEIEWTTLTDYLGGESIASGKLKEAGDDHWFSPNSGSTNEFGFTALPGGYRTGLSTGSFRGRVYAGWWWVSTETDPTHARARLMTYDVIEIAKGTGIKKNGYSVRCIKD